MHGPGQTGDDAIVDEIVNGVDERDPRHKAKTSGDHWDIRRGGKVERNHQPRSKGRGKRGDSDARVGIDFPESKAAAHEKAENGGEGGAKSGV